MPIPLHLLILEDNPSDAELMLAQLRLAGFDPDWKRTQDEEEFLALLDPTLDLILADYNLPQFDGMHALEMLSARGLDLPFILVSGTIGEELAVEAMKRGADDYLLKDRLARLGPAVTRALEQHEERRKRRAVQSMLRQSEDRYRDLVQNSQDLICTHALDGRILSANPAAARMLGYELADAFKMKIQDLLTPETKDRFDAYMETILKEGRAAGFMHVQTADGERRIWEYNNSLRTEGVSEPIVRGMARDVTERVRAEEALQQSEKRFRALIEKGRDNISLLAADGTLLWESPSTKSTMGYAPNQFVGSNIFELMHADDQGWTREQFAQLVQTPGKSQDGIFRLRHGDGTWRWIESTATNMLNEPAVRAIVINYRDVTERVQAVEALSQSEEKYRRLTENALDIIFRYELTPEMKLTYINAAVTNITGYTPEECLADPNLMLTMIHPEDRPLMAQYVAERSLPTESLLMRWMGKDGSVHWMESRIVQIHDELGNLTAVEGITRDMTERKHAEEDIRLQLNRLNALRTIDTAIAGSMDIGLVFQVILDEVMSQLSVDATDVLLFAKENLTLNFAAGRGFRTEALQHTKLPLGEGYAGRVALSRQMTHVTGLRQRKTDFLRSPSFSQEGFTDYFGLPLVAKGEVKGVLEIFQRSPAEPNDEWLDFLETLAGQAAIAIDNVQLFEDLQRSNFELAAAYDATIAGWSHAMDLRDKETEGHTLRVTELTVKLAKRLGIPPQEQRHIRRGALLHDIGKLGVPDSILLKPGKLTSEEWDLMKRHPAYARDMLSTIAYLRPAMDIPYYHHEKWDGTGYPQGLAGEQIPLTARLFAVVDVWDALTSDRPYRPAWTQEEALTYIQDQSGKHFDPQVVEEFLKMIEQE